MARKIRIWDFPASVKEMYDIRYHPEENEYFMYSTNNGISMNICSNWEIYERKYAIDVYNGCALITLYKEFVNVQITWFDKDQVDWT